jgi:hypothetical protein
MLFLSTMAVSQERPPDHEILNGIPNLVEDLGDRAMISAFLRDKEQHMKEFFANIQAGPCQQLASNQITGRQFAEILRTEGTKSRAKTAEAFERLKADLSDEGRATMLEEISMVFVSSRPSDAVAKFDQAPDQVTRNFIATCNRIDQRGGLQ